MLRQRMFLLVFIPTLFVASLASAQDDAHIEAAREHFSRGEIAFSQERWLDCATHFEASFQAIFAPELLYNIGLCYERAADTMGDSDSVSYMERALAAYTRYLRELPASSDAAALRIRIDDLRVLVERARAAAEEDVEPEGDSVTLVPDPSSIVVEDPGDDLVVDDIIVIGHPEDRGFGFGWTLTGGAFTLASFVTAIGLSVAAQEQFNSLAATCGQTMDGCSTEDVNSILTLATSANAMYVVSGVLLAATGLAFGLEFHFWSTPAETHAGLDYSVRF